MCQSGATVKLLASESVNIVEGRGFESRRQLFFFFFFFNIHTSGKVEIFFDHSILVNGVDPWGIHRFLGGITMKTVYTPWVNAMSAAFTGTE